MIGQYVKWNDVAHDYPGMWLCFKNPVIIGSDIQEGTLVDILTDDEVDYHELEHWNEGFVYERTTEDLSFNGIIESDFSIAIK